MISSDRAALLFYIWPSYNVAVTRGHVNFYSIIIRSSMFNNNLPYGLT